MKQTLIILVFTISLTCTGQIPTTSQSKWHEMEFYLFFHFGPNTFTNKEWGEGDEPSAIFNPTDLDTDQWCRIAKTAGAKGVIITAKHHDGFCLWPSKYSTHTVRESKWKNGKGDVLKDLSTSCKKYNLKFGLYISPWDRNHPTYGTAAYNDVFVNMMKELFTNYGPIWELWWDGANGEGPNGKRQEYDWKKFENLVRKISPSTIIFSDIGPDIRWVGNEKGFAAETNWNYLDTIGFKRGIGAPPNDTLMQGNENGAHWLPAECDVSIRPGWFYHSEEDDKVKNRNQLFDLYLKSVGRGANLLLNVPPDRRGRIHENDSAALVEFKKLRDQSFRSNLAIKAKGYQIQHNVKKAQPSINDANPATLSTISLPNLQSLGLEFSRQEKINCVVLREDLRKGQKVKQYKLLLMDDKNQLLKEIHGTTIGRKRIIRFDEISMHKISLEIEVQKSSSLISEIEVYYMK